ncbi:carbon starvation CstA family protein [Inconstantimicrobium porci]|uniref:Carbon starvation protein A n=1 Tax=Inconstantimicrobium porci TaxID=2652291 RepID=A0A7X2MWX3_9CLOT|nr:carbon starvation protein A [Inconstantimicrobium porci]MSR90598.1 carbon starvation protein A [Inconstantimicrobium porci]
MNGLLMVGVAIVILSSAYLFYGRWLANKWGIDAKAKTPAYTHEDGVDFIPTSKGVVFSHQFSSIAGAGPVTGPILAAVFGWVPVLLWLLVGGIFFGAVTDFGAMYASVKNEGKSIGFLIEQYIGKTGKKIFSLFAWLFTLLVIAAFSDMVATTFNGFTKTGAKSSPNAAAASISMLFIVVAMIFGLYVKYRKPNSKQQFIIGVVLLVGMLALGIACPLYFSKNVWLVVVCIYLFLASITPMWLLMQPRDYLSTFLLIGMIVGAVVGVVVANPAMNLPAFTAFNVGGKNLFPTLFVTIACGAVSGFHSLVSSGTSSKTVKNEKDMLGISYGAMLVESLLGVIALVVAGSVSVGGKLPDGTPFSIFAGSVAGFLGKLGVPNHVAVCFMTMCVSALALTSLDSVARIGRMSFQELFLDGEDDLSKVTGVKKVLTNKYFATAVTLAPGFVLCLGGYNNVWPLFGAANQLLSALVLITLVVFLRATGRKGFMLWVPMLVMMAVTFTALLQATVNLLKKLFVTGNFVFMVDGLQLIIAIMLMALGVIVVLSCAKKLSGTKNVKADNVAEA